MRRKVKITGDRSIKSKLHRLAYELELDGIRVRQDHSDAQGLADSLQAISSQLGDLARSLRGEG